MGKWADSLPTIDHGGEPLRVCPKYAPYLIGEAIFRDSTSDPGGLAVSNAELAAAHLRVWRKALPPQKTRPQHGWCEDEFLRGDSDVIERGFLLTIALYHLTSVLRWGVPEDSLTPLRDAEKALKLYIKRVRETK